MKTAPFAAAPTVYGRVAGSPAHATFAISCASIDSMRPAPSAPDVTAKTADRRGSAR